MTLVDDDDVIASHSVGHDLVAISATVLGARVDATFGDVPAPVLLWEHKLYDNMAMTGTVANVDWGRDSSGRFAVVIDPARYVT